MRRPPPHTTDRGAARVRRDGSAGERFRSRAVPPSTGLGTSEPGRHGVREGTIESYMGDPAVAIPIEAYTGEGVLTGVIDAIGRVRDALENAETLRLAPVHGLAFDGRTFDSPGENVPVDALLLVVPDDVDVPVHAAWHHVELTVGPYRLDGELPTMPGFDPGRALARPTGTFVLLREVTVCLLDEPERVLATHSRLLINRYDVETVAATLALGFFFPGAHQELREPDVDEIAALFSRPEPTAPAAADAEGEPGATGDAATAGEASPVA
jgi:hypothetical protein